MQVVGFRNTTAETAMLTTMADRATATGACDPMAVDRTKQSIMRRASATLATAGVLLAVVIAGCGGSGKSSPPVSKASPAAHGSGAPAKASANGSDNRRSAPNTEDQAPAAPAENGGIPQNNGGDEDADNNGGPSDGDGNL